MSKVVVVALYHFLQEPMDDLLVCQRELLDHVENSSLKGTLLLAPEGINGTIAGLEKDVDLVLKKIPSVLGITALSYKVSYADENPFYRMKIKIKREIVTLGVGKIDVAKHTGKKVSADVWDALMEDPETIVVDTRNDYEIGIGTFPGAINPKTETFREFPEFVDKHLKAYKSKKVAMFCTGGIRCEKASAYMKEQGFDQMYQLDGGILKYMEDKRGQNHLWQGDCFVFDNRVSVNDSLSEGDFIQCFACRMPITEEDIRSADYVEGISCPHCVSKSSDERKDRFKQRQKQILLARQRGEAHIGVDQRRKIVE